MFSNTLEREKFSRNNSARRKKKTKKNISTPPCIDLQRQQICDLAARIVQEDGIRDYHKAKLRACEALHIKSNSFLPTNEEIEIAVKRRLNLFGNDIGDHQHDQQLNVAIDLLEILADYHPRLTGALVSGLSLKHSPIEIHVFSNSVELVNEELNWRGIPNFNIEKRYRFNNNEYVNVPVVICQLDQYDIEISVFKEKELHRSPVNPTNGRVYKRLSAKEFANKQTNLDY